MYNTSLHLLMARTSFRKNPTPSLIRVANRVLLLIAMVATATLIAAPAAQAEKRWVSPHFADHDLVGTIWSSDFEPVTQEELDTAIQEANFVLLGETHNNVDHHRLQAQMIDVLVRAGRRPAVVWEMIPVSLQGELDGHLKKGSKDAGKLGKVLQWADRGWPDWSMYQPVAEAALNGELSLIAGALDRKTTWAIGQSDPSQAELIAKLELDKPLKSEITDALATEIHEGHCNMLPDTAVKPMIKVQRARDAQMAVAMLEAPTEQGAVLIAGSGHVRKDWAVPSFIEQKSPEAAVVSIAFLEVDPESSTPADYVETVAGLGKPYDFVYFTPKADLVDRCAEMAEHMKKMKSKKQN